MAFLEREDFTAENARGLKKFPLAKGTKKANFAKIAFDNTRVSTVLFAHYFNMLYFDLRKDQIFTKGTSEGPDVF